MLCYSLDYYYLTITSPPYFEINDWVNTSNVRVALTRDRTLYVLVSHGHHLLTVSSLKDLVFDYYLVACDLRACWQ